MNLKRIRLNGGRTYEETFCGYFRLHGSAVGFLYGLLFRSEGCYLGSIVITDRAVGFRQRCGRTCRDQNLPSSGGKCSGEHHICSVSLDRWLLDMRSVQCKTIQAYDPATKTAYFPCYQAGCKHNDASCTANFGGVISGFAEYRGNFYAMIYYNDDTASAFVTRPVSGGPLQILASWEPENENEECRCGFYGLSFGKAYLTVSKETYAMKDGQAVAVKEEYSKCSLDLETGELVEYMTDEDGYLPYMHGVWGDVAVFQDWYADRPDGTPVKRDGSEDYNFRLYSKISEQAKRKRSWM